MSFAKNAFNLYSFSLLLIKSFPPSAWSLFHLSLVSGLLSCQVVPLPPLEILLVLQVLRNRLLLTPADICSMSQYQYLNIRRYLLNLVQYKYIGVQRLVSAFSPQNGRSAEAKIKQCHILLSLFDVLSDVTFLCHSVVSFSGVTLWCYSLVSFSSVTLYCASIALITLCDLEKLLRMYELLHRMSDLNGLNEN